MSATKALRLIFNNKNTLFNVTNRVSLYSAYRLNTTTVRSLSTATLKQPLGGPKQPPKRPYVKYFLAFVAGTVTYLGWNVYSGFKDDKADLSEAAQVFKPANLKSVSKSINRGGQNPGGVKLTLYQYATCPFCCKVRAYLDYYGYNYDIVEVNSISHQQIKWSEYKKVPILAIQVPVACKMDTHECVYDENFVQLNDSTVIISAMETFRLNPDVSIREIAGYYEPVKFENEKGQATYDQPNKYFIMLQDKNKPKNTSELRDERDWRTWVDQKFIHAISPNVYRTLPESFEAFNWFDQYGEWEKNFTTFDRYLIKYSGAIVMYLLGKMLKKKYQLKDDVRESFNDFAKEWESAVGSQFRGGETPNLADLALYGSMQSFRGCKAFDDLMKNEGLKNWYNRCEKVVKQSAGKTTTTSSSAAPKKDKAKKEAEPSGKKKKFYIF